MTEKAIMPKFNIQATMIFPMKGHFENGAFKIPTFFSFPKFGQIEKGNFSEIKTHLS